MFGSSGGGGGASVPELLWDDDHDSDMDGAIELSVVTTLAHRGECVLGCIIVTSANDLAAAGVYAQLNYLDECDAAAGRASRNWVGIPLAQNTDEPGNTVSSGNWIDNVVAGFGVAGKLEAADFPDPVGTVRRYFVDLISRGKKCKWIVTGTASTLQDVLDSTADVDSPLTGLQLIEAAVDEMWWIHGNWPTVGSGGSDQTSGKAEFSDVLANWPASVKIMMSQLTTSAVSGTAGTLDGFTYLATANPLRTAMASLLATGYATPSSNHIIAAVRGWAEAGFAAPVYGTGSMSAATGNITGWVDAPDGPHFHLQADQSATLMARAVDQMVTIDPITWPLPLGATTLNANAARIIDSLTYTMYADGQKLIHDFWVNAAASGDDVKLAYLLILVAGNETDALLQWIDGAPTPTQLGTNTFRPFKFWLPGGAAATNHIKLLFDPASTNPTLFSQNDHHIGSAHRNNPTAANSTEWGNSQFQSNARSGAGNYFTRDADTTGHSTAGQTTSAGHRMQRRTASGSYLKTVDAVDQPSVTQASSAITAGEPFFLGCRNVSGTGTSTNQCAIQFMAWHCGKGNISSTFWTTCLRPLLRGFGAWDADS